jgi:hypothetical protein
MSPELPRWFGPPFSPSLARGVGRSFTASVSAGPLPSPYGVPSARTEPPSAVAFGVGSNGSTTCDSGGRKSSLALRPGVPVSVARGVGSSETVCRRFIPPRAACPVPVASDAEGVGSSAAGAVGEEEETFALVCRADGGRRYNQPFRIEPEAGKVGEDVGESEGNMPCDVLKDCVAGS